MSTESKGKILHPVINPGTGEEIRKVAWSTAEDVDMAVKRAGAAFPGWSSQTVKQRVQVLFRFKGIIEKNIDELARICTEENGKTVAESVAGIKKGVEVIEYATSLPQLIKGGYLEVSSGVTCRTVREPLGVVAAVTPFNFPVMVPLWKIPIALGCGNTMVLKPSETVPLSAIKLQEYIYEAGLPEGAFELVHGAREVVEALVDHPDVRAISFVGSSRVAEAVYKRATSQGKRCLALGGAKNHLVLLPDADPEMSAQNITESFTGCCGQRCMAASVLITVGDTGDIVNRIVDQATNIEPGINLGPVISPKALERIRRYIDQAERDGATILLDGRKKQGPNQGGYWLGPTIIDNVKPEMSVAREEIFGPVLSIIRVEKVSQAIEIENANPYGNAASVYTRDGGLAQKLASSFSAGMIGVNIGVPVPREPFAFGGRNDSIFGVGDITGDPAIDFWTKTRKITERWSHHHEADWIS